MAAEALEKKAAELGYTIKVETRGSSGAKNVVTDEEIANAVGIIVAADTKVPMERFNGKKVIECKVADGINKSEELINRIMNGDAKEYHAQAGASEEKESKSSGSIGHQITAREILKLKEELYRIISDHSGQPFAKVEADSDRDYWMIAKEAQEYGMIDKVLVNPSKK